MKHKRQSHLILLAMASLGMALWNIQIANVVPNQSVNNVIMESNTSSALPDSVSTLNVSSVGLSKRMTTIPSVVTTPRPRRTSEFAYAYIIGGCNPDDGSYKGFLYSILVSRRILMESGSTSDAIVFVQMSPTTNATTLPPEETRALMYLEMQIQYLAVARSFTDTVMNKFRILTLTQYTRVMFLDADVMPLGNLDYLFQFSASGILAENVVIAGVAEPAHGGLFILTPRPGDWEEVMRIVESRTTNNTFDETIGWGHAFEYPDQWETRDYPMGPKRFGQKWDFNGAKVDQGLLYYWVKYVKKNVSFLVYYGALTWAERDGLLQQVNRHVHPFRAYSKPRIRYEPSCNKFICDFIHFTRRSKPWIQYGPPESFNRTIPGHIWWQTLLQINQDMQLNEMNFTNWVTGQRPPLGYYAAR